MPPMLRHSLNKSKTGTDGKAEPFRNVLRHSRTLERGRSRCAETRPCGRVLRRQKAVKQKAGRYPALTEAAISAAARLQITRVMSSAAGVPWQNFVNADSMRSRIPAAEASRLRATTS